MTAGAGGETPREQAHHVSDPLIEVDVATELTTLRGSDLPRRQSCREDHRQAAWHSRCADRFQAWRAHG
jgi:hypothetical protein